MALPFAERGKSLETKLEPPSSFQIEWLSEMLLPISNDLSLSLSGFSCNRLGQHRDLVLLLQKGHHFVRFQLGGICACGQGLEA